MRGDLKAPVANFGPVGTLVGLREANSASPATTAIRGPPPEQASFRGFRRRVCRETRRSHIRACFRGNAPRLGRTSSVDVRHGSPGFVVTVMDADSRRSSATEPPSMSTGRMRLERTSALSVGSRGSIAPSPPSADGGLLRYELNEFAGPRHDTSVGARLPRPTPGAQRKRPTARAQGAQGGRGNEKG